MDWIHVNGTTVGDDAAPAEGVRLFVIVVKQTGLPAEVAERTCMVVAKDEQEAATLLRASMGVDMPIYQYRVVSAYGRKEFERTLREFFLVGPLDAMGTGSAVRYAGTQFTSILEIGDLEALGRIAGKIEETFLRQLW